MEKVYTERVSGLRVRYIDGLETKREQIGLAWQALKTSRQNVEQSDFRELVHKLAGSAGSYDLDEVSMQAKLIHRSLDHEQNLDDELEEKIDTELERLSEIILQTLSA